MRKHFSYLTLVALTLTVACSKPKTELQKQQAEQALSDPTLMKPTTTRNPDQPEWVDNADRAGRPAERAGNARWHRASGRPRAEADRRSDRAARRVHRRRR